MVNEISQTSLAKTRMEKKKKLANTLAFSISKTNESKERSIYS